MLRMLRKSVFESVGDALRISFASVFVSFVWLAFLSCLTELNLGKVPTDL